MTETTSPTSSNVVALNAARQDPQLPPADCSAAEWAAYVISTAHARMIATQSRKPDLELLVLGLRPDDDGSIRLWALSQGISDANWSKAVARKRVSDILGAYPSSPTHLVNLFVAYDRVQCSYDGSMRQQPRTYYDQGRIVPIDDAELDQLDERTRAAIGIKLRTHITPIDFALRIKVFAADYRISISEAAIGNAVDYWYDHAKSERLEAVFRSVAHAPSVGTLDDQWRALVERCFRIDDEQPVDFVAAVLQKLFWQVKRKILKLPVSHHLMPILLGGQGAGKSMFVERLIGPLAELTKRPDFSEIGDSRNISLWSFYVHFVDEMGMAHKSDVDVIKNRITASDLDLRPMRTNKIVNVRNCATFIGNSNKAMSQLIVDPTGIRRFAPLEFLPKDLAQTHWDYTAAVDYVALWQSVNEYGPDPMAPYQDQLAKLQSTHQAYGSVEQWLREVPPRLFERISHNGYVLHSNLYHHYTDWEDENMPGLRNKLSLAMWRAEMKRLISLDTTGELYGFKNDGKRTSEGMCFRYIGRVEQ